MKAFRDERYSDNDYVYGKNANAFLSEKLSTLAPGLIIFPCDGEGRNAVHAAKLGWTVKSFDISEMAKLKAMKLAAEERVSLEYTIMDAVSSLFSEHSADVVALIYAHFPPSVRKMVHKKTISWLKPNGKIILEAFNPEQLKYKSGGPKDISMLYTPSMLKDDFSKMQLDLLETKTVMLDEGKYHKGEAAVIRLIATKI